MFFRVVMIGFAVIFANFFDRTCYGVDLTSQAAKVRQIVATMDESDPISIQAGIINLSFLPLEATRLIQEAAIDKTVKPQVAKAIQDYLKLDIPREAARKRNAASLAAQQAWIGKQASDEYEKYGHKDARWDAEAREALKTWADARPEMVANTIEHSGLAIKNGCDDPLVRYVHITRAGGSNEEVNREMQAIADELSAHEHLSYWRTECYIKAWRQQRVVNAAKLRADRNAMPDRDREGWLVEHFKAEWALLVGQNVPPITLRAIADPMIKTNDRAERKAMFDAFFDPWEKVMPEDPQLLTFKGRFYVEYAWDARGVSVAGNVTDEGWKKFGERLDVAERALTAAWEKAPDSAAAPTEMLIVEKGQGRGRDRLELWFKRAMEANPDNKYACLQKMDYLQPKWYGSPEEMIKFARECYDTQNWKGQLPLQIEVAYTELMPFVADRQQFLGNPAAWKDIQSIYVPYLRADPKNDWVRTEYARLAAAAGKWDVAQKQFDLLGDRVMATRFAGAQELHDMQAKARELGAAPPIDR